MKAAIGVVLAAICACAESNDYMYTPQTANAVAANLPTERTAIPQERPQGAVEVSSYGITTVRPSGQAMPVLHVRMTVSNDGDDQPWQLDTREQYVSIQGEGRSRALYVNSDVQALPIVSIARRERHVFDLYFPLPDTVRDEARLPHFDVEWQVTTPLRVVASRTTFDRMNEQPRGEVYYSAGWPYWAGWGPYWWYDPFYPSVVFVHSHRAHVAHRIRH